MANVFFNYFSNIQLSNVYRSIFALKRTFHWFYSLGQRIHQCTRREFRNLFPPPNVLKASPENLKITHKMEETWGFVFLSKCWKSVRESENYTHCGEEYSARENNFSSFSLLKSYLLSCVKVSSNAVFHTYKAKMSFSLIPEIAAHMPRTKIKCPK